MFQAVSGATPAQAAAASPGLASSFQEAGRSSSNLLGCARRRSAGSRQTSEPEGLIVRVCDGGNGQGCAHLLPPSATSLKMTVGKRQNGYFFTQQNNLPSSSSRFEQLAGYTPKERQTETVSNTHGASETYPMALGSPWAVPPWSQEHREAPQRQHFPKPVILQKPLKVLHISGTYP